MSNIASILKTRIYCITTFESCSTFACLVHPSRTYMYLTYIYFSQVGSLRGLNKLFPVNEIHAQACSQKIYQTSSNWFG
jgi:hypothetical protein